MYGSTVRSTTRASPGRRSSGPRTRRRRVDRAGPRRARAAPRASPRRPTCRETVVGLEVGPVRGDRRPQLVDASALAGDGLDDRGRPSHVRSTRTAWCAGPGRLVAARSVGLVHDGTSATSSRPALWVWMASPHPGVDDDDRRVGRAGDLDLDLTDADGLDDHPGDPDGVEHLHGLRVAPRPPRWPRLAIERMKTSASSTWPCMRTRSPRIAPPVNGLVGSTASTPTGRAVPADAPDQPVGERRLPRGAPVMSRPSTARPVWGYRPASTSTAPGPPASIRDRSRASAPRSPARAGCRERGRRDAHVTRRRRPRRRRRPGRGP